MKVLQQQVPIFEAQIALGQSHLDAGRWGLAFDCFHAAARSGEAMALNMLGRAYERGWGCARDPKKAAIYFKAAADKGYGWAMFNLADLVLKGDGVPKDEARAFALYADAARAGVSKALNMLGLCAEDGLGCTADAAQALSYFRAGAEAKDCWAALNLGRLAFSAGARDQAIGWFERALGYGFADFYQTMAEQLKGHADPALDQLGQRVERLFKGCK